MMNKHDRKHDELLNLLFQSYQNECQHFAEMTSGTFIPYHRWYRGKKITPDQFSKQDIVIDYGSYELVFTYHFYPSVALISRSVVKLDLYVPRPQYKVAVPLDILMNHLNQSDFTPFVFEDVYDPTVMADVFQVYLEWFERYRKDIEALCTDEERFNTVIQEITEDYTRLFGPTEGINNQQYVSFLINKTRHFIRPPYQLFLLGEYEKSLKLYRRIQDQSFEYERRLINLMETRLAIEGYEPKVLVPQSIERAYRYHRYLSITPRMIQSLISSWVSILLTMVVTFLSLSGLMGLVYWFISAQSLYASPLKWEFALIMALSSSVLIGLQFRNVTHQVLFKKDHALYQSFDLLYDMKKDFRLLNRVGVFFLGLGIVVSLVFGADVLVLRKDGFTVSTLMDNLSLFNRYDYTELDRCEYRSTWINGFGKEIDSPNYTLVYKDGSEISLLSMADIQEVETKIIPILIEKNITVIRRTP